MQPYLEHLQLTHLEFIAMAIAVMLAAVIRGYSGFGFSAIVVAGLSLFTPTREVVPLVILLEVVASVQMFPKVWRHVHWRLVAWVLLGSLVFIPLGQWFLSYVPVGPMRVVCALGLLLGVVFIYKGRNFGLGKSPKGWAIIGVISGTMNGLLAMGGMWVAILLLGSSIKTHVLRASLVALFFGVDIYAAATAIPYGLLHATIAWRAVAALPFLFVGIWLGSRQFEGTSDDTYRSVVLAVLATLALLLLLRATWTIGLAII
ncbi:MAG: putative membrane protein YfcA [Saprospiraceae bacterium]